MWNTCESNTLDPHGRILKCTGNPDTIIVEEYEDDLHCEKSATRVYTVTRNTCERYFLPNNGQLIKRKFDWDYTDNIVNCPKGTVVGVVSYDDDSTCTKRAGFFAETIFETNDSECDGITSNVTDPVGNLCTAQNVVLDDVSKEICEDSNEACEVYIKKGTLNGINVQTGDDYCKAIGLECLQMFDDNDKCSPRDKEYESCSDDGGTSGDHIVRCGVKSAEEKRNALMAKIVADEIASCSGTSATVHQYENLGSKCLDGASTTYNMKSGQCVLWKDANNVQRYRRLYFSCAPGSNSNNNNGNSAFMITIFWLFFTLFAQY